LAYAHQSKLRFEKRKREKKYPSLLEYFFSFSFFQSVALMDGRKPILCFNPETSGEL